MQYTLPQILKTLVDQAGSDLHISVDSPPRIRIDSKLVPLNLPKLTSEEAKELCYSVLTDAQRKAFEANKEIDLAFSVQNLARFRANIFMQKNNVSGSFRLINTSLYTIKDLGLPPFISELCSLPRGLILVTGPTGSGKSTTLAAMIDHINSTRQEHILTIEDPIEYIHKNKSCLVNQRELGHDTTSFARALKYSLRQDPDVVMVGELRDLETISAALTTAETGHLVFATLHTNGCIQTLNRIIDIFPPHQQDQVKIQLSMSLQAVISQILVPAKTGGRVLALEIMVPTQAIRSLIIENKFNQIYSFLLSGQENTNMQTLNQSLYNLVEKRLITAEMALSKSSNPSELREMFANPHVIRQAYSGKIHVRKKVS